MDPEAKQIMRKEREATLEAIQRLPHAESVRNDVRLFCAALQEAVNMALEELDRPVHEDVVATAMRLSADELERVMTRFREAGLAAPRTS